MAKSKSKATVRLADGAGGMTKVQDHRFDTGEWPIQFQVASEHADAWMRYLNEECSRRGWSHSSFGQIDRSENSGSLTMGMLLSVPLMLTGFGFIAVALKRPPLQPAAN